MAYIIQKAQRESARRLGVIIIPSKDKQSKIDVFNDGILVARIGDVDYLDYHLYLKGEKAGKFAKGTANKRKALYKIRHKNDRRKFGTAGFYADQILWTWKEQVEKAQRRPSRQPQTDSVVRWWTQKAAQQAPVETLCSAQPQSLQSKPS